MVRASHFFLTTLHFNAINIPPVKVYQKRDSFCVWCMYLRFTCHIVKKNYHLSIPSIFSWADLKFAEPSFRSSKRYFCLSLSLRPAFFYHAPSQCHANTFFGWQQSQEIGRSNVGKKNIEKERKESDSYPTNKIQMKGQLIKWGKSTSYK